jgi:TRAP-type C4-dicarboxylate transport system substrate-binding protein
MAGCNSALSSDVGSEMRDAVLKKNGVRLTPFSSASFLQLPNNKRAIESVDDVKGMKIRIQSAGILGDSITALGGSPTVIDIAELYTSLQTGAVDGAAINDNTVLSFKLAPVLPYFSQINLAPNIDTLFINDKWYQDLDSDTRKVVDDAANGAASWNNTSELGLAAKAQTTLTSQKVKINTIDAAAITQFRDAVQSVWSGALGKYSSTAKKWVQTISEAS